MTARLRSLLGALLVMAAPMASGSETCGGAGLGLQVLGSGGGDYADGRAGASYLVWLDGKARALIDAGPGAAARFAASGARIGDLDVVLLTHVHADHALDLPALVALGEQDGRARPLPIWGPAGNRFAASTVTLTRTLLDGTRGAYRHLGNALSPLAKTGLRLEPHDVRPRPPAVGVRRDDGNGIVEIRAGERLQLAAAHSDRKSYPALAWRISVGGRHIVIAADIGAARGQLERLAQKAQLLIAPYAMAESAGAERYRRMPTSAVGRLATAAAVERVVLVHRTNEARGKEELAMASVRTGYSGPVTMADDLTCFVVP